MDDTTDELMGATYAALCKHGYASLRMQDIADESSKSKAALHYHYESKQDLLYSFLDYLYDSFGERIGGIEGETPAAELVALLEAVLTPPDEDAHPEFRTALLEIKAQGPYDDHFREELERVDSMLHDRIAGLVRDGQAAGEIREAVDPDETADFIVTAFNGAQTRAVAVGHPTDRTLDRLREYVAETLLVEGANGNGGAA